jgi:hypothetical protein
LGELDLVGPGRLHLAFRTSCGIIRSSLRYAREIEKGRPHQKAPQRLKSYWSGGEAA